MANIRWIIEKPKKKKGNQVLVVPKKTPSPQQVAEWRILSGEVSAQLVFRSKWCPVVDKEDLQQEAWAACWEHYHLGLWNYFDKSQGSLVEYRQLKERQYELDEELTERLKELEKEYAYFRRSVINHVKKYIQRQMPPRILPSDLRKLDKERIEAIKEQIQLLEEQNHDV